MNFHDRHVRTQSPRIDSWAFFGLWRECRRELRERSLFIAGSWYRRGLCWKKKKCDPTLQTLNFTSPQPCIFQIFLITGFTWQCLLCCIYYITVTIIVTIILYLSPSSSPWSYCIFHHHHHHHRHHDHI